MYPARATLSALLLLAAPTASATLIGLWRMDEAGATDGGAIGAVINTTSPGTDNGAATAGAVYRADVPAPFTFDPVSGQYVGNRYSLDAGAANARVAVPNSATLNVGAGGDESFTFEMFIKLTGEPVGYDSFARRLVDGPSADGPTASVDRHAWQMDVDSGTTAVNGYGRARARFDLIGAAPADFNRVSALNTPLLFADTPTGNGVSSSYTGADPQLNGDSLNDFSGWRHFALTYNDATRQFRVYLDGQPGSLVTLSGTYTHPAASLEFGKFAANNYGLLVDEVRYSSGVLTPAQFLQGSVVPEASTAALGFAGLILLRALRRR